MAATARPRRSVLYMPGVNARALEKGRTLPADTIIMDLEDAVTPDAKEGARAQIVAAIAAGGYGGRELVVRVNALSTQWGAADMAPTRSCCRRWKTPPRCARRSESWTSTARRSGARCGA